MFTTGLDPAPVGAFLKLSDAIFFLAFDASEAVDLKLRKLRTGRAVPWAKHERNFYARGRITHGSMPY
jgi:hypothetical protein